MVRVTTGSRLHFGLFSLPRSQSAEPAMRDFGGVGLMIERPAVVVRAEPAASWSVTGPCGNRALACAQQLVGSFANASFPSAFHIEVDTCPPEHVGLGTGTQLELAIAAAVMKAAACEPIDIIQLAVRLGRGQRSALGIHGFVHGGLLVEAGKGPATAVAPLVAHARFPENWRIVLFLPPTDHAWHGRREREAFARLAEQSSPASTDVLCRLTLLQMLPAVHEANLEAFGDALYEFNRRVGEMFRPAQGGVYSHPTTESLIDFVRSEGVQGVGQSSWGPGVFAVVAEDRAERVSRSVIARFGLEENATVITQARNRGATVE